MTSDDIKNAIIISIIFLVLLICVVGYIYLSITDTTHSHKIISREEIDGFGKSRYFNLGPLMNSYNVDHKSLEKYADDFIEPFKENIARFAPNMCEKIYGVMKLILHEYINTYEKRGGTKENVEDCIVECILIENNIRNMVLLHHNEIVVGFAIAIFDVFRQLYGDENIKDEEFKFGIRRVLSKQIIDLGIPKNLVSKCVEEMLANISRRFLAFINRTLENIFVETYEPEIKKMLLDNNSDNQYINLARRLVVEYTNNINEYIAEMFIGVFDGKGFSLS